MAFAAHSLLTHEVEHDAGVELTRPRAHGQTVERREAHRAFQTLPGGDGAHGGATAEMRDHDPALGNFGRDLSQASGDVLIGEAVESVAVVRPPHRAARESQSDRPLRDGLCGRQYRSRQPAAGEVAALEPRGLGQGYWVDVGARGVRSVRGEPTTASLIMVGSL